MFKLPAYVGIIVQNDDQFLLVQRCNTDWAEGFWNFPGGLLEENETLLEAAAREAHEEIGVMIDPKNFELVHVLQARKTPTHNKEILGFYFLTKKWEGTPFNKEPHRHSNVGWFDESKLPQEITEHALQALDALKTGNRFSVK